MPLIKKASKAALSHNIGAEMNAGKPKDQSIAIAYSVQRNARKKKMAKGGMIEASTEARPMPSESFSDADMLNRNKGKKSLMQADWTDNTWDEQAGRSKSMKPSEIDEDFVSEDRAKADNSMSAEEMRMKRSSNDPMGINEDHDEDIKNARRMADGGMVYDGHMDEERPHSVADAIRMKRKMMADGGMVDIEENGEESPANPNSYDDQNELAAMKELYDDQQIGQEPHDSNEKGDEIDADEHDMIAKIRAKMRMKRGM